VFFGFEAVPARFVGPALLAPRWASEPGFIWSGGGRSFLFLFLLLFYFSCFLSNRVFFLVQTRLKKWPFVLLVLCASRSTCCRPPRSCRPRLARRSSALRSRYGFFFPTTDHRRRGIDPFSCIAVRRPQDRALDNSQGARAHQLGQVHQGKAPRPFLCKPTLSVLLGCRQLCWCRQPDQGRL